LWRTLESVEIAMNLQSLFLEHSIEISSLEIDFDFITLRVDFVRVEIIGKIWLGDNNSPEQT
jgi:hypothetical protein